MVLLKKLDWMVLYGTKNVFFYGIAVKNLLSTFIFKSVWDLAYKNTSSLQHSLSEMI